MIGRFQDRPIRRKLMAISMLSGSTALLLAWLVFVAYERLSYPHQLARELTSQAEIIGRNSAAALLFNDPASANTTLGALSAQVKVIAAAIYTARGRRFATYGPTSSAESSLPALWLGDERSHVFGVHDITVQAPIILDNERVGTVVVRGDLREMNLLVLRYAIMTFLVLGVSLGVAYLVAARLQRSISEPILELTETAKIVSAKKNYSVRARETSRDEIGFLIHTFNDMLAQIQAHETELRKARDKALEASRLKSAFLANMSHEIRTPLNVIFGYYEVIEEHLREHDENRYAGALESIQRAGKRLMDTIDGILDISKIETDSFEVHRTPLKLANVIERCAEEARVLAEQKGLVLESRIEEPNAAVVFDEYCLTHALLNLLSNAIKFTENGGVSIRLQRDKTGSITLSVVDTGVGIDAAYLPRLFETFSQEDQSMTRKFEGAGLGLALVKNYLALNRARITVESRKGWGSTFTIHFDRDSEVSSERIVPEETPAPSLPRMESVPPKAETERPAILLVEDDRDTQMYMREILDSNFRLLVAATAEEARHQLALHSDEVRMILMDISLRGGEDGLSLTRSLRKEDLWKAIPIIATTAHAFPEDRMKALAAGCNAYMAKPLRHRMLRDLMTQYLEHPELAQAPSP